MGKTYTISAKIKGKDGLSPVLRRVTRSLKGVGGAVKSVGGALTSLPAIGSVLGGAYGVGQLVGWVDEFAGAADKIAKTAKQAGLGAEAFQEIGHAANLAGVDSEGFASSMIMLNRNLGDLKANRGTLLGFLKKASPSLARAVKQTTSTEEAFNLLVEAMGSLKDPSARSALAMAAFGRQGAKMALVADGGTEALANQRREFRELGGVMSGDALKGAEDFVDESSRLKVAWGGLKNVFGSAFLKAALPWMQQLTEWVKVNKGQIGGMAEAFAKDLVGGIKAVAAAIPDIAQGLKDVIGWVKAAIRDVELFVKTLDVRGKLIARAFSAPFTGQADAGALVKDARDEIEMRTTVRSNAALEGLRALMAPGQRFAVPREAAGLGAFAAGRIEVVFPNAPEGTRVRTTGNAPVETTVRTGRRTQGR